jgi:hypothetical protein
MLFPVSTQAGTAELEVVDAATIIGSPEDPGAENMVEPRVLIRFDLNAIPVGAHIDYAELTVGDVMLPDELPHVGLIATAVLTEWNGNDISWDQPSEGSEWNQPGGDWDDLEFVYGAVGVGLMRPPFFDVTTIVRNWLPNEGALPNYGLMLLVVGDLNTNALIGIIDHTRLRPVLRVTYSEWE